jgi:hypothetical protein
VSSDKCGESSTGSPKMMNRLLKSTTETPTITAISIIDGDVSDPFTCNLIADDGKRCVEVFSGVGNAMIELTCRFPVSESGDVIFRKYIINLGLENSSRRTT